MAVPFVQGRLRKQDLTVAVRTECAHSQRDINIDITSNLSWTVHEDECRPVIFVPLVDFAKLRAPNIIDAF